MLYRLCVCAALVLGLGVLAAEKELPEEVPFVEGQPCPPAKPNEGWCLVRKPASYKTVSERVETQPATFYMEIVPAKFETVEEKVQVAPEHKAAQVVPAKYKTETYQQVIREASVRYEVIPAEYKEVEEDVIIEPAREATVIVPAVIKTVEEKVQVAPGYTYWKPFKKDDNTECFCFCEVPPKFATICKQVIEKDATQQKVTLPAKTKKMKITKKIADAQVKKIEIPAETVSMERRVIEVPEKFEMVSVPAKFETIQKRVITAPEQKRRVDVPAKFETASKQVLEQPSRMVWRKVKCDCGEIVKKYKEIPGTDEATLRRLADKPAAE